jgi:hypothetical protein
MNLGNRCKGIKSLIARNQKNLSEKFKLRKFILFKQQRSEGYHATVDMALYGIQSLIQYCIEYFMKQKFRFLFSVLQNMKQVY